jgi:hypothetical protein
MPKRSATGDIAVIPGQAWHAALGRYHQRFHGVEGLLQNCDGSSQFVIEPIALLWI